MADKHLKSFWTDMEREQFMRIANARLKKIYKFEPQRKAWCGKMWVRYFERKNSDLSMN